MLTLKADAAPSHVSWKLVRKTVAKRRHPLIKGQMEKATLVRIFCPVKYYALAILDSQRDIKTFFGRLDN